MTPDGLEGDKVKEDFIRKMEMLSSIYDREQKGSKLIKIGYGLLVPNAGISMANLFGILHLNLWILQVVIAVASAVMLFWGLNVAFGASDKLLRWRQAFGRNYESDKSEEGQN